MKNTGSLKHDFWIAGKKTPLLAKGKSASLTVTIKKRQESVQVHRRGSRGRRA